MQAASIGGMANNYYTYLLIDPRSGLPFYVGKGKGRRCSSHVAEAKNSNKSSAKLNKIRKIESLGMSVIVKKVEENVSDFDSKDFEMLLIAECKDLGINLTNRTDGGDGSEGYQHSMESRSKISAKIKGRTVTQKNKERLSALFRNGGNPMHNPEVIQKTSGKNHWNFGKPAMNKGIPMSEAQKQKLSEATSGEKHHNYGKPCSEARKQAIKAGTKGIKKSTTVNMCKPRSKVECPHCGKVGGSNVMARWHFDSCKEKK